MPTPRFSRRVIERVAENRIRQAYEEGQFENLPGLGRPLPGIEEPYDPLWWLKKWIRRERLGGVVTGEAWQRLRDELQSRDRQDQGRR